MRRGTLFLGGVRSTHLMTIYYEYYVEEGYTVVCPNLTYCAMDKLFLKEVNKGLIEKDCLNNLAIAKRAVFVSVDNKHIESDFIKVEIKYCEYNNIPYQIINTKITVKEVTADKVEIAPSMVEKDTNEVVVYCANTPDEQKVINEMKEYHKKNLLNVKNRFA